MVIFRETGRLYDGFGTLGKVEEVFPIISTRFRRTDILIEMRERESIFSVNTSSVMTETEKEPTVIMELRKNRKTR